MTEEELKKLVNNLDLLISDFKDLAKGIMKDDTQVMKVDLISLSIVNRAIALIKGFKSLVNDENTYSALHLIRIQVDNLIRYYSILVAEDENYIDYILDGNPINKFKDKNGKFFSDRYLVNEIEKKYKGIDNLYSTYCGHIHFGIEHIERIKTTSDNPNAKYRVTVGDFENYSQQEREELVIDMVSISVTIYTIINDWLETKIKYHY